MIQTKSLSDAYKATTAGNSSSKAHAGLSTSLKFQNMIDRQPGSFLGYWRLDWIFKFKVSIKAYFKEGKCSEEVCRLDAGEEQAFHIQRGP